MHDARNGQIDRGSSPGAAETVGTRRRYRLPEAALGAAIIGLMLAPPQATASASITATANEGCLPAAGNAGGCDGAFTEPLSAGDGGREAAGPSPSEAED